MWNTPAFLFGGKSFVIGPRIVPLSDALKNDPIYQGDDSGGAILEKQLAAEKDQAIQYRTCSWQKAAALLFSEYISLAVMSFPLAYASLGLVPGLILTVAIAAITLYTSLILWEFCLRHPEVRDVCDIGQMICWGKEWAWWVTTAIFILNNTFVQGIHVLVGAQYMNTITDSIHVGGCPTVQFSLVITIAGCLISLPRTFSVLSKLGTVSAICTFLSLFLATIFSGIQGKPAGYDPLVGGEPIVTAWPLRGTTFVQAVSACLAMSFTFFGQVTLPSFIAEMRDPR